MPGYAPQQPAQPVVLAVDDRAQRFAARPLPTSGSTLAGVGIGLVVFGVIIWAGGYATSGVASSLDGGGGSSSHNWLGIVLSLGVTALGYAVAAVARRGPLATAGVAASALGVPTALAFITLDLTGGDPINVDAVFVVSIVVWLISYAVMPGARGHGFYLGLGALALWIYLIIKISPSLPSLPAALFARAFVGPDAFGGSDPTKDLGSLTAMSFILGAAFYAVAFVLDSAGHRGSATPLVAAAFPITVGGFLFAAKDFGQTGEGVALLLVGFVLVLLAARSQRRFTTWAWGFGILVGIFLLIQKASPDNNTSAGLLFILCGLILAGLGVVVASALGEREYPEG